MKKWILALFCAALTSAAWAQSPQYVYPMPMPVTPVGAIQQPEQIPAPAPSPAATGAFGAPCANGGCGAGGCCQQPTKKVCMPEPSIKVKVSIKYSSVCEDKCYRNCFWPFGHDGDSCNSCGGGCASGICNRNTDSPNCGHVYTKKYLVKRIVTEDIPITKCTPVEVPTCGNGFAQQCGEWQYPAQPGVAPIRPEPIPAPMPNKSGK